MGETGAGERRRKGTGGAGAAGLKKRKQREGVAGSFHGWPIVGRGSSDRRWRMDRAASAPLSGKCGRPWRQPPMTLPRNVNIISREPGEDQFSADFSMDRSRMKISPACGIFIGGNNNVRALSPARVPPPPTPRAAAPLPRGGAREPIEL